VSVFAAIYLDSDIFAVALRLVDSELAVDFNTNAERQARDPHGYARIMAPLRKYLYDEIGGSIGNEWVIFEVRCACYEYAQTHATLHAIKLSIECRRELSQEIKCRNACSSLNLLNTYFTTQSIQKQQLAAGYWNLRRDTGDSPLDSHGHKVGHGYGGSMQCDA
jgi:hypothetical protein